MKRILIIAVLVIPLAIAIGALKLWKKRQPDIIAPTPAKSLASIELPMLNKQIVQYIEANGPTLAPDYNGAVCTEFVIKVIDHFTPLDKTSRRDIRIITDEDLETLINNDAEVIRGVQTALIKSGKGSEVKTWEEVRPGDFVQFWSTPLYGTYGHCGIVEDIIPGESITLYSSHPVTNGYGIHRFVWPEKIYFARLNVHKDQMSVGSDHSR